MRIIRRSHPEPDGQPDRTPVQVGEVWENPVTRERVTILERPWDNPVGRAAAEMTALVGARVAGEHYHPALVEQFTALEGELTVRREGRTSILHQGETAVIQPGTWHDWWNASDHDARVRVEVTPGERFLLMIETFFGLARLGYTDGSGMPSLLQQALTSQEFSDVIVFRSPPPVVQRVPTILAHSAGAMNGAPFPREVQRPTCTEIAHRVPNVRQLHWHRSEPALQPVQCDRANPPTEV
jgi:quercetin dioxygenase-like cupin family protein